MATTKKKAANKSSWKLYEKKKLGKGTRKTDITKLVDYYDKHPEEAEKDTFIFEVVLPVKVQIPINANSEKEALKIVNKMIAEADKNDVDFFGDCLLHPDIDSININIAGIKIISLIDPVHSVVKHY